MINPQIVEAMRTSTSWPSATSSVSPIPTVLPDVPIYESAGDAGKKTLWVVFAVMFLSTLVFALLAFKTPVQKRLFHILTTFITAFATLSYFAMATGAGNNYAHFVIHSVHKHVPDTIEHVYRQIFWARYVDWSITTPLILINLSLLAGLNGANILVAVVANLIMVLTGFFAAYGSTEGTKWGWYAMAIAAYLVVVYQLAVPGRREVLKKDAKTGKLYTAIAVFAAVVWTLYPIVWAVSDGARKTTVDTGIIAYAVLDILAKPVFGFWLLFAHGKNISPIGGFWSYGLTGEGAVRLDDDDEV